MPILVLAVAVIVLAAAMLVLAIAAIMLTFLRRDRVIRRMGRQLAQRQADDRVRRG